MTVGVLLNNLLPLRSSQKTDYQLRPSQNHAKKKKIKFSAFLTVTVAVLKRTEIKTEMCL